MKLVHKKTGKQALVGDIVESSSGEVATINYFREPHKPSSEGKLTVNRSDQTTSENYVGVWGLEWIEREDRGPKKERARVHNEYFRTVSLGGRKSCPRCKSKLNGESIWSWGEYLRAKWRTVQYFCKECFPSIQGELVGHAAGCGCNFQLIGYRGEELPEWLNINVKPHVTIKRE